MNGMNTEMEAAENGMKQWRGSPGHYANIMREGSNTLGASLYYCSRDDRWYLTQLFGKV